MGGSGDGYRPRTLPPHLESLQPWGWGEVTASDWCPGETRGYRDPPESSFTEGSVVLLLPPASCSPHPWAREAEGERETPGAAGQKVRGGSSWEKGGSPRRGGAWCEQRTCRLLQETWGWCTDSDCSLAGGGGEPDALMTRKAVHRKDRKGGRGRAALKGSGCWQPRSQALGQISIFCLWGQ